LQAGCLKARSTAISFCLAGWLFKGQVNGDFVLPEGWLLKGQVNGHFVLPEGSPSRAGSRAPALHPRYPANTTAR